MAAPHVPGCGPKRKAAVLADPALRRDLELAASFRLSLTEFYDHPDAEDQIAAWEIRHERCPHHGGPLSECEDLDGDWYPQRHICRAEMEEQAARRRYDLLHEDEPYHDGTFESWAKEPSLSHPYRFDDGVHIWVSDTDLTPEDDFLVQGSAVPDPE